MTAPGNDTASETFKASIEDLAGVHREIRAGEGEALMQITDLTVRFGGLVALDAVNFDVLQRDHRGISSELGFGDVRWCADRSDQASPDHPAWHCTYLSEHPLVR